MTAGIDDVGIGVLFGLDMYRYDFAGLLMHAEHLEAKFGVGLIRSVFQESVLLRILILTISKMQSMMISLRRLLQSSVSQFPIQIIVSTRETQESRERVLKSEYPRSVVLLLQVSVDTLKKKNQKITLHSLRKMITVP